MPALRDTLALAVKELSATCPFQRPEVITSAGTYVAKPGQHGLGRAVDIDAIFWSDRTFITNEYPADRVLYLAIESIFRRHFGLGLNYLYNAAHHDHLHFDLSLPVGYNTSSRSATLFLQAALNNIHGQGGIIDGQWGPQTSSATSATLKALGIKGEITTTSVWKTFLLKTAEKGFDRVAASTGSAIEAAETLSSVIEHTSVNGAEWHLLRGAFDSLIASPKLVKALEDDSSANSIRLVMAQKIVDFEARRTPAGKIKVYKLPKGDGGGSYEVAGINDKYHPEMARKLRDLIEKKKQPDAAERLAVQYIATYTDAADRWCANRGIEFYLRDSIWNRGATGAARIVQIGLDFKKPDVDGLVGPKTLSAIAAAEANPLPFLSKLRAARQRYEEEYVHRDPSSPFWKGLVNRWNKAEEFAKTLI